MEITNVQPVKFETGETVAFFDLKLDDYIVIHNCNLSKNKSNNNFYWDTPYQMSISKKTGRKTFTKLIQIYNYDLLLRVLKQAQKLYYRSLLKTRGNHVNSPE
jgi:hypothetical protein